MHKTEFEHKFQPGDKVTTVDKHSGTIDAVRYDSSFGVSYWIEFPGESYLEYDEQELESAKEASNG